MRQRSLVALIAGALAAGACFRSITQFDRYFIDRKWTDAAREFEADTSLRHKEEPLYRAGLIYGTPALPTYDAAKARDVLMSLVTQFPNSPHGPDATARLLLIEDVARARRNADQLQHELEGRIAQLGREVNDLKARLDALTPQTDSLKGVIARLELERRDREEQIRTLRSELTRLKEIDLKPRPIKPAR